MTKANEAGTPRKLAEANAGKSDDGIEWGEYVERYDDGAWTPLIYSADGDHDLAAEWAKPTGPGFRNQRLVRRVVGDWKVVAR